MPKPVIILLCLDALGMVESIYGHLISALEEQADVRRVATKADAMDHLNRTPRPHAVLICDGAVTETEHADLLRKLADYVKEGGTAICTGVFSSLAEFDKMSAMFKGAFKLPWTCAYYTRDDWTLNRNVKGIDTRALARKYSMKAVGLGNVSLESAVYLDARQARRLAKGKGRSGEGDSCQTPISFAAVGKGHIGFVGDVNGEEHTTAVVVAMAFRPAAETSPAAETRANVAGNSASKPKILIISLEKESYTDSMYEQLYRALRKNASVTEALDVRAANRALSLASKPTAVLVSDAAITKSKHAALLKRLVEYARSGGRVVLAVQFSNHFPLGSVGPFFRTWGLQWDKGSYHRTTFGLNPAGVPTPLSADALFPRLSMKALHVKNAPRECAVYLPTPDSQLESLVWAPRPIAGAQAEESPAVFAPVGKGYLGYVGDVNGEQGSTRLVIEMLGVKIKPGDMGPINRTVGVRFRPGGGMEEETRLEEEIPLPPRSAPSSRPLASASGGSSDCPRASGSASTAAAAPASVSSAATGSGAPSSSSSQRPPHKPRSPPRPREAEVTARAAERAKVQERKAQRGDALKDEGNALFKQEKWLEAAEKYRQAAMAAGPLPVYMSNLAAALLKLQLWDLADDAATRALTTEPTHVKALFRRAQARKELRRFKAAERDLRRILSIDKSNAAARTELAEVLALKRTLRSADWPEDEHPEMLDIIIDLEESDSEDFKHRGNGTPCRFYNHDGCKNGKRCRFRHAPDDKSVRDELGRNVCIYWLLGKCRFGDERCVYAHDRTYLPERGWWDNETRNKRLCEAVEESLLLLPRDCLPPAPLATAVKPDSWRKDMWAAGGYARVAQMRKRYGDGSRYVEEEDFGEEDEEEEYVDEDGIDDEDDDEEDEYDDPEERMNEFYEEMLMQGIKPWEVESYDELMRIQRAIYEGY
ncbi:hypothetical protein BV20DRAFT_1023528 [Pilatotrama ljubarskyi]|nr:hypothetical protein BV20DRAFT_1023528 [Pilatotrama ljubarskyi]